MFKRTMILLLLVALLSVVLSMCDPTPTSSTSPSSCPPISGPVTANVPTSGDDSGVTIPDGTYGYYDSGGDWCATGDLAATKINVDATIGTYGCFHLRADITPPCSPYSALAAIDIQPSDISFTSSIKPSLRYDLQANEPECMQRDEPCGGFAIYQLLDPPPPFSSGKVAWLPVGTATETTYGGKPVAEGDVNHFSIFALVELPGSRPITPPVQVVMVVASDFFVDDQGDILAAFQILEGNLEEIEETRLFRFSNVDPA